MFYYPPPNSYCSSSANFFLLLISLSQADILTKNIKKSGRKKISKMNVSYTKKAGLPGIKWKSDPYSLTLHGSLLLGDSGVVNMLQQYSACKGSLSEWIKMIFLYSSSSSVSGEGLKVKVNSFHMRHKGQQTPQGQCWSLYLHWSIKASRSITETHTHTYKEWFMRGSQATLLHWCPHTDINQLNSKLFHIDPSSGPRL